MRIYTTLFKLLFFFSFHAFAQPYNFDGIADGATGTFSNGWIGNSTTGYRWEANSGMTGSPSTGPAVDHTLGTTLGIYLYTEASSPAAPNDTATLTSPVINLSTTPFPGLKFWYHRYGGSMSPCYIDIFSGGTWNLAVDSLVGQQQLAETDPWLSKTVSLLNYSGNIQIRFRSIRGINWDSDMAIDDVSLVSVPAFDVELLSVTPSHHYVKLPLNQSNAITFSGAIKNVGGSTVNSVSLNANINGVTNLTGSTPQLLAGAIANITTNSYTPNSIGAYYTNLFASISQSDADPTNDSAQYLFEITDTVMARENDGIVQGIGFNGATGVFGQMFELFNPDSLTSVSFKLTNPTINDYLKLKLYQWNDVAGAPGAIIDSSNQILITSDSNQWYTNEFTCDRVLSAGKYFFAVEQVDTNNLTFGYTSEFYEAGVTFYNAGTGWTPFENVGFQVALAIRPNFGPAAWPTVDLGADTSFCDGSSITLNAGSGFSSYQWSTASTDTSISVSSSGQFWVTVLSSSGCAARDTVTVTVDSVPNVWAPQNVGICDGVPAIITAHNNPNYTYLWSDGSTDSTLSVSAPGTVYVTVTDVNGCSSEGFSFVNVSSNPVAEIVGDTIYYCAGDSGLVSAAGSGNIYTWSNGANGNSIYVSQPGWLSVTVSTPFGCSDMDSAWVIENPAPAAIISDTLIEFCDNSVGNVSVTEVNGADYVWSNGATTSSTTINSSGTFFVTVSIGSCESVAQGEAVVLPAPSVDLGPDTTVCDTVGLFLWTGIQDNVLWGNGETTDTITVYTEGDYTVTVTSANGCTDSDTINVKIDNCSGISDVQLNLIEVYPNPMVQYLRIQIPLELVNTNWVIYNSAGVGLLFGKSSQTNFTINVNDLTSGNYFIQFGDNESPNRVIPLVKY